MLDGTWPLLEDDLDVERGLQLFRAAATSPIRRPPAAPATHFEFGLTKGLTCAVVFSC